MSQQRRSKRKLEIDTLKPYLFHLVSLSLVTATIEVMLKFRMTFQIKTALL
jgi:hypothetical protein